MLDFEKYLHLNGEIWVQAMIEQQERFNGKNALPGQSLKERWDNLMNTDHSAKIINFPPQAATNAISKNPPSNQGWIKYTEVVDRFGQVPSEQLLICLENLADIHNEIANMECNKRWDNALTALNEVQHTYTKTFGPLPTPKQNPLNEAN